MAGGENRDLAGSFKTWHSCIQSKIIRSSKPPKGQRNLSAWCLELQPRCGLPRQKTGIYVHYLIISWHSRDAIHGIQGHPHGIRLSGLIFHGAVVGAVACHEYYHGKFRGDRHGIPRQPRGMTWQSPPHPLGSVLGLGLGLLLRLGLGVHGTLWKMPRKVVPQVVLRHATACREKERRT